MVLCNLWDAAVAWRHPMNYPAFAFGPLNWPWVELYELSSYWCWFWSRFWRIFYWHPVNYLAFAFGPLNWHRAELWTIYLLILILVPLVENLYLILISGQTSVIDFDFYAFYWSDLTRILTARNCGDTVSVEDFEKSNVKIARLSAEKNVWY